MRLLVTISAVVLGLSAASLRAAEPTVIDLWPTPQPERDTSTPTSGNVAGRPVIRLGNVSKPQVHIFPALKEKANGTAVVVCPGGGFSILAWDLEGTEVAEWLNSIGVTAAVVKYRVPTRNMEPNWLWPAQDAQQAIRLVREKSAELGVDPSKVGVLGFSAGGQTAAMTALKADEPPTGKADDRSVKPDFLALIYPAYLVDDSGKLKSDIAVTKDSPPAFLVHAYDDPVTPKSSVQLFLAYKDAGAPAELHVYDTGGHGYGLRPTEKPVTHWSKRCEEWMNSRGLLRGKEGR